MKLGITAKLFLAILAACVAVLLINGIAVQAFVKRQFLDYLNEQGVERMQETLPRSGPNTRGTAAGSSCATIPMPGSS